MTNEKYPKEKIIAIDKLIAEQSKKEKDYKNLMAKADKDFGSEEYKTAIDKYKQALKNKTTRSKTTKSDR